MGIGLFILALAVRIVAIEATGAGKTTFGDAGDYVMHATSICEQHVYPERGNLPFFRAPGLPFFIAGVTACEPTATRAIKYGLALCDALTVLLLAMIAWRLALPGWIAGLLAALHPFFVAGVTDIRSEPLFMMLLVAAIYCALADRPALAGLALGLAALTRPTGLLCVPLFALFFVTKTRWKRAIVFLAAAALTLAPWIIRNAVRYRELIVVNDAGGFNLWRGTHPDLLRIVRTHDRAAFAHGSFEFETRTIGETAARVNAPTPAARSRQWTALAIENARKLPMLPITLWKAAAYWRLWLHPAEHGRKAVLLSAVVFVGLYLLGAIGLARHPDKRIALAVVLFFAAMWLAHLPYIPTIRLRLPLVDPLILVFAAGPIAALVGRASRPSPAGRRRPAVADETSAPQGTERA